jgi:hypothetical protein
LLFGIGTLHTAASAQSTAFTLQGRLDDAGVAADGLHDLRFRLFDAASGGAQLGPTLCIDSLLVTEGLFTATLDFGPQFSAPAQRFIEIDVRRDAGLSCADPAGFDTLSPRQLITAAPLATHAKSAFALDAADGSPANAVVVDNNGNVGVNTPVPLSRLHVTSGALADGIRLTGSAGNDPSIGLFEGTTARGVLGLALATGNYSQDAVAGDIVLRAEPGRKLLLQSGLFASALAITSANNVGLGTPTPAAKLDVRGNIRLGSGGQFFAAAGEENLRIVRGTVGASGSVIRGAGFTASRTGEGFYQVLFTTPFGGVPSVTCSPDGNVSRVVGTSGVTSTGMTLQVWSTIFSEHRDVEFHFVAVGPR